MLRRGRAGCGAEQQLLVGIGGQGGVEVDRIGQVEVALDMHGPGGADPGQQDVEAAVLGGREPFCLGALGVKPGLGLLDQPLQLGGADLVRHRRVVLVHERRRCR